MVLRFIFPEFDSHYPASLLLIFLDIFKCQIYFKYISNVKLIVTLTLGSLYIHILFSLLNNVNSYVPHLTRSPYLYALFTR